MESKPQAPGGPAGIDAVLRDVFLVPATPSIRREDAARRILARIGAEGMRCERLDLSDQPVRRGALFDASSTRVPFPKGEAFDHCYVALIDPEVMARWAHPAHWAFVPADGSEDIVLQPTQLPESSAGPVRLLPVPLDR